MSAAASIPVMPVHSLSAAIYRYRGEWNVYLASCLEAEERGEKDDTVPAAYEPTMRLLESWNRPAESLVEAMLALELAVADYEVGDTPRIPAMMNASLAWLKAEQKRRETR